MSVREGNAAAVRGNIAAAHREQSQLLRRRRLDRGRLHVARAWPGAPRRVRRALRRRREGGRARTGKLSGTQLFVHGGARVSLERANDVLVRGYERELRRAALYSPTGHKPNSPPSNPFQRPSEGSRQRRGCGEEEGGPGSAAEGGAAYAATSKPPLGLVKLQSLLRARRRRGGRGSHRALQPAILARVRRLEPSVASCSNTHGNERRRG